MINELRLNLTGKILLAAIGAWLVGRPTNIKIRGTEEEVSAITAAMKASQRFHDKLHQPGATVESVVQLLGMKHASAREFKRILGVDWPL